MSFNDTMAILAGLGAGSLVIVAIVVLSLPTPKTNLNSGSNIADSVTSTCTMATRIIKGESFRCIECYDNRVAGRYGLSCMFESSPCFKEISTSTWPESK